ncbi:MAG: hypothetical protein ABIE84_03235, partial [bacterium]
MSILSEGLSSVQSLTAQIEKLQALDPNDPATVETAQLMLQQNFNSMLDNLLSNNDDDDDDNSGIDPFNFLTNNPNQLASNNIGLQNLVGIDYSSL